MGKLIILEKMITSFSITFATTLHPLSPYLPIEHAIYEVDENLIFKSQQLCNPSCYPRPNYIDFHLCHIHLQKRNAVWIMSFLRETLPLSSSLLKGRRNSDNNNINEKSACWLTSMICAYIPLPEPQNFHELGCHTTARIALRKTGKRRRKRKTEPTNRTRWQGNMWNHQGHTNLTSTSSSGANFWLLSSFFILLEKRVSWSADVPCSHMNTHTQSHQQTTLSNSKLQT